jgi:hypothetical protein
LLPFFFFFFCLSASAGLCIFPFCPISSFLLNPRAAARNSYEILEEAGLPAGVVNFVPAPGKLAGDSLTASPHLAAINFTGSTRTFNTLWKQGASPFFFFSPLKAEGAGVRKGRVHTPNFAIELAGSPATHSAQHLFLF